jgi:two-component system response regulator AtoC
MRKVNQKKRDLLIIDDEVNMRHMLEAMLTKNGYRVVLAENGLAGYQMVQENRFDFILCDIRMPEMGGMEFLKRAQHYLLNTTVIMMSAYSSIDLALDAIKQGAYDFISKPFKIDEVLLTLKKAEERELLKEENCLLKEEISTFKKGEGFVSMVGGCKQIHELFALARKVAQYDTTVLITGESGTGKELLARGIHQCSPRKNRKFYAINCASIPENLMESEMFGFVKGAFTGADKDKKGIFAEANGSTLFLDEIGELPLAMQVKLLRVIQEREIRPVGATRDIEVDVRILAATSRDLLENVHVGEFREDLFYRLNVMPLHIPPLRERQGDIHLLCLHFIKKMNAKLGRNVQDISLSALLLIMQYAWPGNVRELENVIERAIILSEGVQIEDKDLPVMFLEKKQEVNRLEEHFDDLSLKKARRVTEKLLIEKALKITNGNKSKASELLELSYPSLLSKIKEYDILP